jgi:hypothetical protein
MEAVLRRAEQAAYDTDEEKLLIEQAQNGSREAFEELVRKHDRDILRLASHAWKSRRGASSFPETSESLPVAQPVSIFESSFATDLPHATNVSLDHLRKRQTSRRRFPTNPIRKTIRNGWP